MRRKHSDTFTFDTKGNMASHYDGSKTTEVTQTKGRRQSLCLVLLPGLDGTGNLFRAFRRAASDITSKVVSLPDDAELSYRELTSRVARELPTDRPFALLGESFSGPLAIYLAAQAPKGLAGLILCNTFVTSPIHPAADWLPWHLLFRIRPPGLAMRLFLIGRQAPRALCSELAASLAAVPPRILSSRIREVLRVDASSDLMALGVPVLVLRGRQDRLVGNRSFGQLMAAARNGTCAVMDGPHLLLQVRPNESYQHVSQFLSTVAPRW